jgi:hypothetical protein
MHKIGKLTPWYFLIGVGILMTATWSAFLGWLAVLAVRLVF